MTAYPVPRRVYLVDRAFQLKYIGLLMGWGLVLAVLFGLWTYQAHQHAVEVVSLDPALRAVLERGGRQLLWTLVGISLLSTAALGLLGFVMTHRIAGPVYVMGHYLTMLAEGRYPHKRTLRKHDELKVFYHQFLHVVDVLRQRDQEQVVRLEDAIARMRVAGASSPELTPAIGALEIEVRARRQALADAAPAPPSARAVAGR